MTAPRAQARRALVSVGSNLQPRRNVPAALKLLAKRTDVVGVSTFYRTAPLGGRDQPAFVNGVWELRTDLPPAGLKQLLAEIEADLGRVRSADRYAPRPIDLDLLICDERVSDDPDLPLPHPDLARAFVAVPLRELAPDLLADSPAGDSDAAEALRRSVRELVRSVDWTRPPGEVLAGLTADLRSIAAG